MATHISFTLPINLSPEQTLLLKEMFQLALRKFGRNVVRPKMRQVFSEDKTARIDGLAELARMFEGVTPWVDEVDGHNRNEDDACPCCGVDSGSLRGIGSSIW